MQTEFNAIDAFTIDTANPTAVLSLNPLVINDAASQVTLEITEVSVAGWAAKATHLSSPEECGIFVGGASPPAGIPVPTEGGVGCTNS